MPAKSTQPRTPEGSLIETSPAVQSHRGLRRDSSWLMRVGLATLHHSVTQPVGHSTHVFVMTHHDRLPSNLKTLL
ncbi:unnamed protein product [Protopolystoma xenopodis]|uniref:Uncharacterized protein n=1 Tax=Protopolystoma xenopodis TaxID=117903 RepID=A0A3S5A1S0_9PLAT|nr:unnamed protein product [Protopolystoma xenopodis]